MAQLMFLALWSGVFGLAAYLFFVRFRRSATVYYLIGLSWCYLCGIWLLWPQLG